MALKTVYQTLENRGESVFTLEANGPYPCNWENTWLGDGYYFWDHFIENAHWWGKEVRRYGNGYLICRAKCDFNDLECCDLVGNTGHLEMFYNTYELMKENGLANKNTTVRRLIGYLKDDLNCFNFSAIRAFGLRSKNHNSSFSFTLNFEEGKTPYLDFRPAIQICFYSKTSLGLRDFKLIYPAEYSDDYLV